MADVTPLKNKNAKLCIC